MTRILGKRRNVLACVICVVLATGIAVTVAFSSSGVKASAGLPAAPLSSDSTDQQYAQAAAAFVLARTGSNPPAAAVYHSTRGLAESVVGASGDGYDATSPVTVVIFRGEFKDAGASSPNGQSQPQGSSISVVYNSATGAATDYGIGPFPSNIDLLGQPNEVAL